MVCDYWLWFCFFISGFFILFIVKDSWICSLIILRLDMFSHNIGYGLRLQGRHHIVERVVDNHLLNLLLLFCPVLLNIEVYVGELLSNQYLDFSMFFLDHF